MISKRLTLIIQDIPTCDTNKVKVFSYLIIQIPVNVRCCSERSEESQAKKAPTCESQGFCCCMSYVSYSHSIVADGFGDMS